MPCPKLAEGDVVRVTRVDSCGRPVTGEDNAVVSECWASVEMAPNINTGTDIEMLNMRGQTCGYKRACPDFRGFDITASFWEASPEMIEILTGNPLVFNYAGEPVGWDDCTVACDSGFGLEIFQSLLVEDCDDGTDGEWGLWLLPWLSNGVLGNLTVNNTGLQFTLTANTRPGGGWELGPWDVMAQDAENTPGPLLAPLGPTCHRRFMTTTIEPPTAQCGWITVPPTQS
jgi:hypothetical protein